MAYENINRDKVCNESKVVKVEDRKYSNGSKYNNNKKASDLSRDYLSLNKGVKNDRRNS